MCVLALAWNAHPRWRLVAMANRDEFHARPAAPLTAWNDGSGIIAGRDLRSGGTWLGIGEQGRFAALTNLRSDVPPDPLARTRGDLVAGLLRGVADPGALPLEEYNPFSLIAVDARSAWLLTNRPEAQSRSLERGIHGLTNGPFAQPWPKLAGLTRALEDWIEGPANDPAALFAALRDEHVPPGAYDEATALPPFIVNDTYGTRCSTVVLLAADGTGTIIERSFDAAARMTGEVALPAAL